jgi:hypothetical protein
MDEGRKEEREGSMIRNQLVIDFSSPPVEIYDVLVDASADFLKLIVSPEGIVAFYNVPHNSNGEMRKDQLAVVIGGAEPPKEFFFIDILSSIVEGDNKIQKLVVFPIYMKIGEPDLPL